MPQRLRASRPQPPQSAWHPRNWGQCTTLAALWVLGHLPWRIGLPLGRWLGGLGWRFAGRRRAVIERNLELCLPELSATERRELTQKNLRALGQAAVEAGLAWYGGKQVERIPHEIRHPERVTGHLDAGRPVILLSAHFLSTELMGRLMPDRIRATAMYKPVRKKPVFDRAMRAARRRNASDALPRGDTRAVIRAIRGGNPICFIADQDYGRAHSVFVPFFGVPAATITTLFRLARITDAQVVPMFFFWEAGRFVIHFDPALEGFPTDDDAADARRMNTLMEAVIRAHPEQYLWMHRRFKHRPDPHEPGPY